MGEADLDAIELTDWWENVWLVFYEFICMDCVLKSALFFE